MDEDATSSGSATSELIKEEILRRSNMISSIESRAQSLIQTSAAFVTALFAIIGFLAATREVAGNVISQELGAVGASLGLLVLAIALSVGVGWPFRYRGPAIQGNAGLAHYISEGHYDDDASYAEVALGEARLTILKSIYCVAKIKGWLFLLATASFLGSFICLAYVAYTLALRLPG